MFRTRRRAVLEYIKIINILTHFCHPVKRKQPPLSSISQAFLKVLKFQSSWGRRGNVTRPALPASAHAFQKQKRPEKPLLSGNMPPCKPPSVVPDPAPVHVLHKSVVVVGGVEYPAVRAENDPLRPAFALAVRVDVALGVGDSGRSREDAFAVAERVAADRLARRVSLDVSALPAEFFRLRLRNEIGGQSAVRFDVERDVVAVEVGAVFVDWRRGRRGSRSRCRCWSWSRSGSRTRRGSGRLRRSWRRARS